MTECGCVSCSKRVKDGVTPGRDTWQRLTNKHGMAYGKGTGKHRKGKKGPVR